jgi:transposase
LNEWVDEGVFQKAWARVLRRRDGLGEIDGDILLGDATFSPAQKGGFAVGNTKRGQGCKLRLLAEGKRGFPLGIDLHSPSPSEVRLIEPRLETRILAQCSPRLVYDKAADSDPLRQRLAEQGIELVCPHRANRKRPPTQDGRKLRRDRHRWKIERTFAWLGHFRRLVVRYDRQPQIYEAFFHIACALITLRHL